jgi:hypothetical protein
MRMPPFMRNSNGNPLTLTTWQHALLMEWVKTAETVVALAPGAPGPRTIAAPLAAARRERTLARIGRRRP